MCCSPFFTSRIGKPSLRIQMAAARTSFRRKPRCATWPGRRRGVATRLYAERCSRNFGGRRSGDLGRAGASSVSAGALSVRAGVSHLPKSAGGARIGFGFHCAGIRVRRLCWGRGNHRTCARVVKWGPSRAGRTAAESPTSHTSDKRVVAPARICQRLHGDDRHRGSEQWCTVVCKAPCQQCALDIDRDRNRARRTVARCGVALSDVSRQRDGPKAADYQTILSQLIVAATGSGVFYYVSISSILVNLTFSANTSFAGFPRICGCSPKTNICRRHSPIADDVSFSLKGSAHSR